MCFLKKDAFPPLDQLIRNGITVAQKSGPAAPADWMFAMKRSSVSWFDLAYAQVVQLCGRKIKCKERFATLTRAKQKICKSTEERYAAPEYSPWFNHHMHGKDDAFFRGDPGNMTHWKLVALDMRAVIVRGLHDADCYRLIGDKGQCAKQSQVGWNKRTK